MKGAEISDVQKGSEISDVEKVLKFLIWKRVLKFLRWKRVLKLQMNLHFLLNSPWPLINCAFCLSLCYYFTSEKTYALED